MDDLTNSINSIVMFDDSSSSTSLASSSSRYCGLYKKKLSTIKSSQEERRRKILEEQKKKRECLVEKNRNIVEIDEKKQQIQATNGVKHKKIYKKAPYQLMFSEWLEEIPYDFDTNWIVVMCPVGKRVLVVASEGTTTVYNKVGKILNRHRSELPGGNGESKIDETVLDCIYNEAQRTYYVLDCLCWKSHPIIDTESEFRFYWLKCKLDENCLLKNINIYNPYKFEDIPRYLGCSKETIKGALEIKFNFELDGLLFYHKETHYTCDHTPLVGWLKAYMLPEILNVDVPQWIMQTAPSDYKNAHNTIVDSNVEIQRFKTYLHSKTTTTTTTDDMDYQTEGRSSSTNGSLIDNNNENNVINDDIEQ